MIIDRCYIGSHYARRPPRALAREQIRRPLPLARRRHRRRRAGLGAQAQRTDARRAGGDRFEQMRDRGAGGARHRRRIPYVRRRGEYLYNFWRDAANPRGLWRRTTLESYRTESPDWDVVIDLDALAAADDENWVWAGADVIEPEYSLAMISLSRGGVRRRGRARIRHAHKAVRRRRFRACPKRRPRSTGRTRTPLLVGTDFGDGLDDRVRLPAHGQALAARAAAGGRRDGLLRRTHRRERRRVRRPHTRFRADFRLAGSIDFFNAEIYELRDDELIRIDVPTDATLSASPRLAADRAAHRLVHRHRDLSGGSLLAADYDEFLSGTAQLQVVFEPDEHTCLNHYAWTRDQLVVVTLADVASRVEIVTPGTGTPNASSACPRRPTR